VKPAPTSQDVAAAFNQWWEETPVITRVFTSKQFAQWIWISACCWFIEALYGHDRAPPSPDLPEKEHLYP